jgi:hypothetical protein
MATGSLVYDASFMGTTTVVNDKMQTVSTGLHGTVINKVIPCSSVPGIAISFWFNISSIPASTYYFLFTIQDALGYPRGKRFYITIDPSNRININGQFTSPTGVIFVNRKYHIVINITNTNTGKVYLNNNLIAQGTATYPSFANVSGYNSIGRDPAGNGIIGTVDDFRLYTRILTLNEINILSHP